MSIRHAHRSALAGFLFILPFVILNVVVAFRVEPVFSAMRLIESAAGGPWPLFFLLALFPVAFFVTIRPLLRRGSDGKYHFAVTNFILGVFLLFAMIALWGGLSVDVIVCDILHVPNCD